MARERTLREQVEFVGIGLHTGAPVTMKLLPGEPGTGRVVRRTDLGSGPTPCHVSQVTSTVRGTNIGSGEEMVYTVEHVLAALSGCGVDNVCIELDGPEPPAADGSALPFVEAIESVGTIEQDGEAPEAWLDSPFEFRLGDAEVSYVPAEDFRVTFEIDFDHPHIGRGSATEVIDPATFRSQVAPARTFCMEREVDALRSMGLIRGGSLENAVVVGEEGIRNEGPLRMPDEFARHKLLDLVGDLALVPGRMRGHVIARCSGHATNVAFAKAFLEAMEVERADRTLDIHEVKAILPHRYPFLFIDRVLDWEPNKSLTAIKNVTVNEPFFQGHFPGRPVMPGVLLVEAMAQAGSLIVYLSRPDFQGKLIYFMGVDKCRFREAVYPGDQVRLQINVTRLQKVSCMEATAYVGDQIVADGTLRAMVVDAPHKEGDPS